MLLIEACQNHTCPTPEPCICPPALTVTTSTATRTSSPTTSSAPKVPGRSSKLGKKMSKTDKKVAIDKEDNPIKVVASFKKKGNLSGLELELDNTTRKTVTDFKGFVYGFNKMDDPKWIALGNKFTVFTSAEGTKLPPGKTVQWYRSHYKLGKDTTALVEVVKVKYADGSRWQR